MVASRKLEGFAMKPVSTFRLTFHVSHPSVSASEIEIAFGLPTRFSQSVGMPRKTKTGKLLDGIYDRTNVSFSLHENPFNFDEVSITSFIKKQLDSYDPDYINWIFESGGNCNFLIGVFSSNNVMFEFSLDIIHRLSSLNISVSVDFYGGED